MPQFDFANVFLPQFVWLLLFFAILYFGIVRLTLPKVGTVMQAREDKVTGDIAAAEAAKLASNKLAEDYATGLDAAHKSAAATVADARAKAAANLQAAMTRTGAALAERLAESEAALAAARAKAVGEIDSVSSELAADIVERLTGKRPASGVLSKAASTAAVN
jgi:F-type H+-transporting ATPase subunit b